MKTQDIKLTMWLLKYSLFGLFLCVNLFEDVSGHGRLIEPPSRSSMWRFGFNTEPNYNDNELFCGGFAVQFQSNGGKCGICGDSYSLPQPRPNEAGGKYGKGIIARHYKEGQTILVRVELTANHQGFFEFKLCPNNNPKKIATQECLDQYPLELVTGGGSKYYLPTNSPGFVDVQLKLPSGLTCTQCVLQWRYTSGNNWGACPDGTSKVGCGPQETFMGCADIAVGYGNVEAVPQKPNKAITGWLMPTGWNDVTTTTQSPFNVSTEAPVRKNSWVSTVKISPPEGHPITVIKTVTLPPITTTSIPITTTPIPITTTSIPITTTSIPITETKRPKKDRKKDGNRKGLKKNRPAKKPEISKKPTSGGRCRSAGAYKNVPGMSNWCNVNCAAGFCPESHCSCS